MATQTVAQKSFFAHLYDAPGVLAKVDGELLFFSDAGNIVTIEPQDCTFLTVLGAVSLAQTAQVLDRLHGGAAWIVTHRQMEVA
jgi:hypothetical protein